MDNSSSLSDEQWNRLLDNMANRQPHSSSPHAHASDPGYGDFSTENLNQTINDSLGHSANYAEANLNRVAAPQIPEI